MLERRVLDTRPPRVEYRLTAAGRKLRRARRARCAPTPRSENAAGSASWLHTPVDADRFLRELPDQLEDVSRFAEILEAVPGLAKPNNLALLNVAARCLGDGESYVEVGTYHGTSLISAHARQRGRLRRDRQLVDGRRQPRAARGEPRALRARGDHDRRRRVRDAAQRRARRPHGRRLLLRQRPRVRTAARRNATCSSRTSPHRRS